MATCCGNSKLTDDNATRCEKKVEDILAEHKIQERQPLESGKLESKCLISMQTWGGCRRPPVLPHGMRYNMERNTIPVFLGV